MFEDEEWLSLTKICCLLRDGSNNVNLYLAMKTFRYLFFILLLHAGNSLYAQKLLRGKIFAAHTDTTLGYASVYNASTRVTARSGMDGLYTIAAKPGDRMIFSASGYRPDTIRVSDGALQAGLDVPLEMWVISLKGVNVTNSYQADSLARREYYSDIYNQPDLTGRNRPADGVGISISPFSYLSKGAKEKRQLRKRLEREEREAYIDNNFQPGWVSRATGLKGDSLSRFLYVYRPSYEFCRKTDHQGMLIYVNDKMKEFRK